MSNEELERMEEQREATGRKAEAKAVEARAVLEHPLVAEALESLKAGCQKRWEKASTAAEREEEWRLYWAAKAFEGFFKRAITRGTAAAAARLERERRVKRAARRVFG